MKTTRKDRPSAIKATLRDNLWRIARVGIRSDWPPEKRENMISPEKWLELKRPHYLSGSHHGTIISPRTLRNAIMVNDPVMPGIDVVEALAHALKVIPAELLVDWERDGERLMRRIMRGEPV